MTNSSLEPLPPGWGALSMVRATRRRAARWPWFVVGLALFAGAVVAIGWISRA